MSTEENKTSKKGVGKFFSNLLYGPEDSVEETVGESVEEITVSNTSSNPEPIQNFNIPITGDGIFDKTFNDAFQQLIADNNIEGIDYFEFKQALQGMSGVAGLNEAVTFQTVFNTLRVGDKNLTKEKLLSAVDHYVGVLRAEELEFKSEMTSSTEQEVTSRRQKAESLNIENTTLVQQIQNINEKIQQNNEEALRLNGEAANAEAKIGQTHKNFITTLAHVVSNLETDKEKIEQLIKE